MRVILILVLFLGVSFVYQTDAAFAQNDPLRIDQSFTVLDLSAHITPRDANIGEQVGFFAIQNSSQARLDFVLVRAQIPGLMAFLQPAFVAQKPLRLFASDDTEYATHPDMPHRIAFRVGANATYSFVLLGAGISETIWAWSPFALARFEQKQNYARFFQLALGAILLMFAFVRVFWRWSLTAGLAFASALAVYCLQGVIWYPLLAFAVSLPPLDFIVRASSVTYLILVGGVGFMLLQLRGLFWGNMRIFWRRALFMIDLTAAALIGGVVLVLYYPWIFGPSTYDMVEAGLSVFVMVLTFAIIFTPARPRRLVVPR